LILLLHKLALISKNMGTLEETSRLKMDIRVNLIALQAMAIFKQFIIRLLIIIMSVREVQTLLLRILMEMITGS
jgi:hypothetical protein